ncbi:MAG: DUF3786 domain-containing protein [Nitrospirota bacterium]
MNPLDIYKKLPRSNCGKCPALTCMSFALRLSKNECSASECPGIDERSKKEIEAMLSRISRDKAGYGDWKQERIKELFKEISAIDFSAIEEGIGAVSEHGKLKVKYMGREIVLDHSDFYEQLGVWDKLLVLMYIKNAGSVSLSRRWTAFRDLKNGLIRAESFNETCETPLARMFGENRESFINKLIAMGAEKITGFSTEYSFVVHPLPKIPFLILIWPGEAGIDSYQEDFEPACKVLLDSTAADFLDVEALLYLGLSLMNAVRT